MMTVVVALTHVRSMDVAKFSLIPPICGGICACILAKSHLHAVMPAATKRLLGAAIF
jgi:hypothetical protein